MKPLRVTVHISALGMKRLLGMRVHLGLDVVGIEEQTPAGWTRRLPDAPKGKR